MGKRSQRAFAFSICISASEQICFILSATTPTTQTEYKQIGLLCVIPCQSPPVRIKLRMSKTLAKMGFRMSIVQPLKQGYG